MAGRSALRVRTGFLASLATVFLAVFLMITQPDPFPTTTRPAGPRADPARLEEHVRALSERFVPRDYEHPRNLEAAAEYVEARLAAAGFSTERQPVVTQRRTFANVIGRLRSEAPEVVVVGAHYDAFETHPGADDNASGVAGLLELARMLQGVDTAAGIELVAFTLEEPPFFREEQMGSAVHAESMRRGTRKVRAMLALEMIGYFTDQPNTQDFPHPLLRLFYSTTGNYAAVIGNFSGIGLTRKVKRAMRAGGNLPVYSLNGPALLPGVDFSDHRSYWARGIPAVMVTDTAFYRNPHYHTPEDTADKLDYVRMAEVVNGVRHAVLELAK